MIRMMEHEGLGNLWGKISKLLFGLVFSRINGNVVEGGKVVDSDFILVPARFVGDL